MSDYTEIVARLSYPLATLTGEQLTALIREARRGVPPYVPSEDAQPTRLTLDEP